MARGFNPNAGGAGPEGSLLVQGKLGLLPQVPGQSGRHSDGTLSKHKEKRNNYLPGAGFWNWTQDLMPIGQHSPPSHNHSSFCFIHNNRRSHLHSLALNLWSSCSRLLNKLVDQAPVRILQIPSFLPKLGQNSRYGFQHSADCNKWCVNNPHENISCNINTNTLWELKLKPFWISAPLPCSILTTGRVPNRVWNWSKLNTKYNILTVGILFMLFKKI